MNSNLILGVGLLVLTCFLAYRFQKDGQRDAQRVFESIRPDRILAEIHNHAEIVEYWFIDSETTRINLAAGKLEIEYTKQTTPHKVVEFVRIVGQIEFANRIHNLDPIEIAYSQTEQELLDLDSLQVRTIPTKTGLLEEQIILQVSEKVHQGDFGLDYEIG